MQIQSNVLFAEQIWALWSARHLQVCMMLKVKKTNWLKHFRKEHFQNCMVVYDHTAWIGIWITKRPGTNSDNCFIFKKIYESLRTGNSKKVFWPIVNPFTYALFLSERKSSSYLLFTFCFYSKKLNSIHSFVINLLAYYIEDCRILSP